MEKRDWMKEGWLVPAFGLRVLVFAFTITLGFLSADTSEAMLWGGLLLIASVPGTIAAAHPVFGRLGRLAEVLVIVLGTLSPEGWYGWLLPYLVAPLGGAAMFGGLREDRVRPDSPQNVFARYPGLIEAGVLTVIAAAALGGTAISAGGNLGSPRYAVECATAVCFGVLAAGTGHWLRHLLNAGVPSGSRPYAEATALLTQLRAVTRQLPGGTLDPGGIATDIVHRLRGLSDADRAAVLVAGGGNRLVVLAQSADDRVDWETSLPANAMLADSWADQQAHIGDTSLARSTTGPVSSMVVPLVAERRTVGLALLECDAPDRFTPETAEEVVTGLGAAALRLETALLFDEVRSIATTEERQRLAREIHDGIAQELAMLGYGIDHALAQLPEGADDSGAQLQELRDEVTRLVTELRLSLFELRSEVDRLGGLTTAIADYARTVGASAGLRVHLSLDEGGARLPAATEAELLRIAQEAMTNARKHARAENLWVTCEIDPPYARIEVADDGKGLDGDGGDGRYGLTIMSERAERIRGSLEIRPRKPHGTTVAVLLAASARPGSVSSEAVRE
ncbi:GAF domain-containing protein [Stackebrandtia albiflava]|uniref:GAF domain-containing protein n=1 Tax=Stackebrandtia albiflava TaxID=406432 RepID=A0A562VGX4_9ACTN|nr:GAF domain-containing protein [Stackebrandtia albiflava]TWJ17120.1 GAF domain-containing protein [Stackebrandtia albiflava]